MIKRFENSYEEYDDEEDNCEGDEGIEFNFKKIVENSIRMKRALAPDFDDEEDDEENMKNKKKKKDYVQWNKKGEGSFIPMSDVDILKKVPPAVYKISYTKEWGFYLKTQNLQLDELFLLPQIEQELILKDITKFWDRQADFEKYKYAYKRGILLYGPAGNGKCISRFSKIKIRNKMSKTEEELTIQEFHLRLSRQ